MPEKLPLHSDSNSDSGSIDGGVGGLNSEETDQLLPVTMEELCDIDPNKKGNRLRQLVGRNKKSEKRPLLLDGDGDELSCCFGCMKGEVYIGVRNAYAVKLIVTFSVIGHETFQVESILHFKSEELENWAI